MKKEMERTVFLPIVDDGDERLEVGLNGTMFILKRGEEIAVPESIYQVLRNAGLIRREDAG